jgi:putative transposase
MKKRHTPEQIVRKLREADRVLNGGGTMADGARQLGVSEATYSWGAGGAEALKRLKTLEQENSRLEGHGGGAGAGYPDPKGSHRGKLLRPARRRAAVRHVQRTLDVSERRAC